MHIDGVKWNWHVLYPVGHSPLLDWTKKNKLNCIILWKTDGTSSLSVAQAVVETAVQPIGI